MIKLASCCKRSATCTVRSRPICSSQYYGVRPSNRADSGAPMYSIIRGSCRWMPYDGSRSSRFVRSLYDVIRYWQPDILSNTIGDCPGSWIASQASKGPSMERSGPASFVATHSVAEGDSFVAGETSVRTEVGGTVGGVTSATVGATVDPTVCGGSGSCNDRRKPPLIRADYLWHWRKLWHPWTTEFFRDRVPRRFQDSL